MKFIVCKSVAALSVLSLYNKALAQVTWEEQSERLLRVNATLLDGMPVALPFVYQNISFAFLANTTLLPKVNPKVGSKSEKVPSSPLHAVPTIRSRYCLNLAQNLGMGLGVYGGYLPSGAEKLFGIEASMTQWAIGLDMSLQYTISNGFSMWVPLMLHRTLAKVKGAITTHHAHDTFSTHTTAFGTGLGLKYNSFWVSFLGGPKSTTSTFYIDTDKTTLNTTDTLSEEKIPGFLQGTVGWQHSIGAFFALSQLWVPQRVLAPRVTVGFDWSPSER